MVYRGDDLDLRIPHELHTGPHESQLNAPRGRGASGAERLGPIWVDETLLESCNSAFGIALAHRHAEVQVEHLVFAFTGIPAAARALEERGAKLAALRHEMGSLIASEIPPKKANGSIEPRRADAFEDVLRIAAGTAYRYKSTVSVDDVINVLLDFRHDIPGAHRIRGLIGHSGLSGYDAASDAAKRDRSWASYSTVDTSRSTKPETQQMVTDTAWQAHSNAGRLDVLENSIRGLANELANERSVISGVLHDLQRDIKGQRDTGRHMASLGPDKIEGFLADRLTGLEQALMGVRASTSSDVTAVREQLASVERSLSGEMEVIRTALHDLASRPAGRLGDTGHLTAKLEAIEAAVGANVNVGDRLQAMDAALAAERDRATGADNYLGSTINALAQTVQSQSDEIGLAVAKSVNERLAQLGIAVEAVQHSLGTSDNADAISSMNAFISDSNTTLTTLNHTIDENANAVANLNEFASQNATTLTNLNGTVDEMQTALYNLQTSLQAMGGVIDSHIARTATADQQAVEKIGLVEQRQEVVANALDSIRGSFESQVTETAAISHSMQAADQAIQTLSRDTGHAFSMLSARIENLEKAYSRPNSMIDELVAKTDKVHRLMVERYFRRNRLWYWLFGTDDWLSASWQSQTSRIARHLKGYDNNDLKL